MIMNAAAPASPVSSNCGANPLYTAIAAAETPSTERRPKRSASNPELTIASSPTVAPTISTIRKVGAVSLVNSTTQDSGNTVTMWNKAKLASGANAPTTIFHPSDRIVAVMRDGCNSGCGTACHIPARRPSAAARTSATTLSAKATKNG